MQEEPMAAFIIMKYNILKNLGSGYTFSSLDKESFETIKLLNLCMNGEGKYMEVEGKKQAFYHEALR